MARSNVQQVQPRLVHEQESTGNSVGAILRGARLARGENLEEIAKSLRIRQPYLEAIEEGRLADLPGLTYAVGFVRGYAKYLELDTDDLVERFRGEARSLEQKTELVFPEPLPSSRVPGAALLFIVVLLSGLTYGGWLYLSSQDRSVAELIPALPDNLAQLIDRATGNDDATLAETTGTDATGTDTTGTDATGTDSADTPDVASPTETTAPAPETAQTPETTGTTTEAATETTAEPTIETTGETTEETSVEGALNDVAATLSGADASEETATEEEAAATATPDQEAIPDQEASSETVPGTTPESAASDATAAAEANAEAADLPETAAASEPAVTPESEEAPSPDAATTPSVDVESLPEPETTQLDRLVEDAADTQTASTATSQETETEAQTQTQTETTATSASTSDAGKVYGTDSPDARVVIEAKMAAWVSVESAAGETVFSGTMYPGDRFRVPNESGLTLITGNAGAFDVRVDGRAAPPFGSLGEVRRDVALDPASLLPSN